MEPAADPWEGFADRAREFGPELTPDQIEALQRYMALLCEWNQRFNLTAIDDPAEVVEKHFLDSLSCALALNLGRRKTLIDVGTGAGFPGLVLKIAYPHLAVVLLDSLEKRLKFLDRVIAELGLEGVRTVHSRSEDAARRGPGSLRESFDVVTARAVAQLRVLAEWTLPFARVGGQLVAMKGPEISAEVEEARRAIKKLGGGEIAVRELTLPGTNVGRSLVTISKDRPTPPDLPRRAGAARKEPL